jgi:hypothetical protein
MKNTLTDLNSILFEQLSRISGDMTREQLADECARTKVVTSLSKEIIDTKRLMLEITKHADECMLPTKSLPIGLSNELS